MIPKRCARPIRFLDDDLSLLSRGSNSGRVSKADRTKETIRAPTLIYEKFQHDVTARPLTKVPVRDGPTAQATVRHAFLLKDSAED